MGFNFNGVKEYQWADVTFLVGGVAITKVSAFEYGIDTEKSHLHLAGDDPASIQSGNRTPSGFFEITGRALDAMNKAAIVAGGRDINDLEWDAAFTYKPKGTDPVVSDVCLGIQTSSYKKSMSQNDKSMKVRLPFLFMKLAST